jgi:pimeloyl-ACP methyl ester carboxylesterase
VIPLLLIGAAIAVVGYVAIVSIEAIRPPRRAAAWAIANGLPVSPEALGLEAAEWTLSRDGADLPVWDIRIREAGPTVVFVHGWGRSRVDSLARIGPFLGVAGRIVLPDLRGHGDASGSTRLGDAREEADLADLLDRLGGERPIILAGHSMGATLAIRAAAADRSGRVAAVVAIAPYDSVRTPLRCRLVARDLPAGPFVDATLAALAALGIGRPSTLVAANSLRVPLLVVAGDADRVVPIDESRRVAEAGRGEFIAIAGGEHSDLDRSDRAGEAIGDFRARIPLG